MNNKIKKRVLIIDDNEQMGQELKNTFVKYNEGNFSWPQGVLRYEEIEFEAHICQSPTLLGDRLKEIPEWDVYVIDCVFGGDPNDPEDREALFLLRALSDLQENAIKIVWTAYPNTDEMIECMRLGAWSYLDKSAQKYGSTCRDVIINVIEALQRSPTLSEKILINQEGRDYIVKHYGELFAKYKGMYLAFEKQKNEWKLISHNSVLHKLYREIKNTDRNKIYITLIHP